MTGQALYELAMDILALRFPDGDIPASCDDMTGRALGLINLLITENAFLDARLKKSDPAVVPITALSDEIGQSAEIVSRAMPYGLGVVAHTQRERDACQPAAWIIHSGAQRNQPLLRRRS